MQEACDCKRPSWCTACCGIQRPHPPRLAERLRQEEEARKLAEQREQQRLQLLAQLDAADARRIAADQ